MQVIYDHKMVSTARLYKVIAGKLASKVSLGQIIRTHVDTWNDDFSLHIINDPEFDWITKHSNNHLCFLEKLHAQQMRAHLDYDPLSITPITDEVRIKHNLSTGINKLNADRVARSLLVKKKFIACGDGIELITYNGFVFSASERRQRGGSEIIV